MNILIVLFILTGITNIIYLSNKKMHFAKNVYILSLLIMVILFCFISDNVVVKFIINTLIPSSIYDFVNSALNTLEYVSTYLLLLLFVTEIQILCSLYIINYKLIIIKYKLLKNDCHTTKQRKNIFNILKEEESTLYLNKVYIDLCKMLN